MMLSGSGVDTDIDEAFRQDVAAYLVKPAGIYGLRDMVPTLGLGILLQHPHPSTTAAET